MIQPVVGSIEGIATFSAFAVRSASVRVPWRSMLMMVAKSTTSKETSIQASRRFSWIASFIGSGTICPPPLLAMITAQRQPFGGRESRLAHQPRAPSGS